MASKLSSVAYHCLSISSAPVGWGFRQTEVVASNNICREFLILFLSVSFIEMYTQGGEGYILARCNQ